MLIHKDLDGNFNSIEIPINIKDETVGITINNGSQKIDVYSADVPPNKN